MPVGLPSVSVLVEVSEESGQNVGNLFFPEINCTDCGIVSRLIAGMSKEVFLILQKMFL